MIINDENSHHILMETVTHFSGLFDK